MNAQCIKIRLKPGMLDVVRQWATELNNRSEEVIATLQDEHVKIESVFLESNETGDYLIYYMIADDFDKAAEVANQSSHAIDAYHKDFKKKAFDIKQPLEKLIHFENL